MNVRVKICGVNSPAAFDAAAQAGADWIGFVFSERSPRYVTPAGAARLSGRLLGGPGRIGLFVDPTDDEIAETLDVVKLHALQLYAPGDRISRIRAKFGVPVWRAVGIMSPADLPDGGGIAAALVIEPKPPENAARPGGNGVALHWTMLKDWHPEAAWLLAGGLTPENVAQAIVESGARAVDVSSGVESSPGVKDPVRITQFIRAARR